jgi:hypothetical protein
MSDHDTHTETVGETKDPQAKADANRAEKAAEPQMADDNPQDHPQGEDASHVRLGHHAPHPKDVEKAPPLPGEPGYVAPARIALPAGQTGIDLRPEPGVVSNQTPQDLPRDTVPLWEQQMLSTRMAQLDRNSATIRMEKAADTLRAMCLDFPYEADGELAAIISFFRDLAARRAKLGTAAELGRTVDKDDIDAATFEPTPEHFQLRALATDAIWMMDTYDDILQHYHLDLPDDVAVRVDAIRQELHPYAQEVHPEAVAGQEQHVLASETHPDPDPNDDDEDDDEEDAGEPVPAGTPPAPEEPEQRRHVA